MSETVEISWLAPFVLPRRLTLDALAAAGGPDETGLVFAHHRSSAGAQPWRSEVLHVDRADGTSLRVDVRIDARSVGTVRVRGTHAGPLESTADLEAVEEALTAEVDAVLGPWLRRQLDDADPTLLEDAPPRSLPPGRVLWWHRILVGVPVAQGPHAVRKFGVPAAVADEEIAVANGFTCVASPELTGQVRAGLEAATVDWVLLDEVNRELAAVVLALHAADADVPPYDRILRLQRRVAVHGLLRDEQRRYLANTAGAVLDAARQAWRVEEEAAAADGRVAAIRDLAAAWTARALAARDERRNRLVYALTLVVALQGLLAVVDFVTGEALTVHSTTRAAVAAGFVLAAGALILLELRASRRRQRGRR